MDPQQQFCLKWNSFGSNLATAFSNLFKSESLADVTLFCEGVSFRAHKLILAACSKHLADLFEAAPLHQSVAVILDGVSADNMSALLEFMYKGEVHVSQDALSSFLKAAESLQVKGLSIEHEKLAVAQSHQQQAAAAAAAVGGVGNNGGSGNGTGVHDQTQVDSPTSLRKYTRLQQAKDEAVSDSHGMHHPVPSPSSYSPAMSPYMTHYRSGGGAGSGPYEPRLGGSAGSTYGKPPRPIRSPSELQQEAAIRASVLRDGSKAVGSSRPGSPAPGPLSLAYRPSSSSSSSLTPLQQPEADAAPHEPDAGAAPTAAAAFDRTDAAADPSDHHQHHRQRNCSVEDSGCPEDLRMKLETPTSAAEEMVTGNNVSANGAVPPMVATSVGYECDRDAPPPDISLWNSMPAKLSHKAGSVTTPDGKKLKCPFCERLYGYETNLRAHIRQRHQGIRVPCPFCSRTFTRNNTVRRHIAREHKAELSMKSFHQAQQQQQHVHNHQ